MRYGKHVFAICDAEQEYAFRFMEYMSRRRSLMFQIRAFTSPETLISFAKDHEIEILLISERSMCEEVMAIPVGKLVILSEGGRTSRFGGYQYVYKYQSSDALVREIMEQYGNAPARESGESVIRTRALCVYGIYAPAPCLEKQLFALAAGSVLAERRKVLYANMESFSGMEALERKEYKRSLGDLLYIFRQSGPGLLNRFDETIHTLGGMDMLPPVRTPSDFLEVTGEEWIRFFECLTGEDRYDVLILDIGQSIPDVLLLLAYCSKILIPTDGSAFADARIGEFRRLLEETENGSVGTRVSMITVPQGARSLEMQDPEGLKWGKMGAFARAVLKEEAQKGYK